MSDTAELPFSTEAEQYLLSTCIVNDNAIEVALDSLTPEDFYWPDHVKLFALMQKLHGENRIVDHATLSGAGADNDLLHLLLDLPAVSARTRDYAEQVRDLAIRRRVVQAGYNIMDIARGEANAGEVLARAERVLYECRTAERRDAPSLLADTLDTLTLEREQPHFGLRTHLDSVNDIIIGMAPGSFNILAARPGQGKTCMACDIARYVSEDNHVVLFSVEMTKKELAERMVAAEATVGLTKIRTGTLDADELEKARAAISKLKSHAMTVDDSSSTMSDVQRKVRSIASRSHIDLVIVDYIQLLTWGRGKQESRQLEVAAISRALKLMAREYEVPVIGVSQLNRPETKYEGERKKAQKPTLASLRDSGALEQDADQVWFLYRPDEASHEVDFIVAKNRSGPTDTTVVHFWPQFTTFFDIGAGGWKHNDPDSRTEGRHEEEDDREPEEMF